MYTHQEHSTNSSIKRSFQLFGVLLETMPPNVPPTSSNTKSNDNSNKNNTSKSCYQTNSYIT